MIRREIVEAGAGCGKTSRIVQRYFEALGWKIAHGKTPLPIKEGSPFLVQKILCLSFTKQAAFEMKERILKVAAEIGDSKLIEDISQSTNICTFHSFCLSFLKKELFKLGYKSSQLSSVVLAEQIRKKAVFEKLSKWPKLSEFLDHSTSTKLVDYCLQKISKPSPNNNPIDTHKAYQKKWHSFVTKLLKSGIEVKKTKSEVFWINDLIENCQRVLDGKPDLESLSFSKGQGVRAFNKEHAEVLSLAQSFNSAIKEGLAQILQNNHSRKEFELYQDLDNFCTKIQEVEGKILDYDAIEKESLQLALDSNIENPDLDLFIVDEFQDSSPIQLEIIEALAKTDAQYFFVGDPKQSIYQFRNADVRLFFKQSESMAKEDLHINYRSSKDVLEFCNIVQADLFKEKHPHNAEAQWLSCGNKQESQKLPTIVVNEYENKKTDLIEEVAKDLQKTDPALRQKSAVLFRSWKKLYALSKKLTALGVKHLISGSDKQSIDKHPLTEIFTDALLWSQEKENTKLSRSLMKWQNLSQKDLSDEASASEQEELLNYFTPFINASNLNFFEAFCDWMDVANWPKGTEWLYAVEEFISEQNTQRRWQSENKKELAFSLKRLASLIYFKKEEEEESDEKDCLELLTIHGSKGLEFEHLYLAELYTRRSPHPSAVIDYDKQLALDFKHSIKHKKYSGLFFQDLDQEAQSAKEFEERRLFYVALTRAKNSISLYLPAASSKNKKSKATWQEALQLPHNKSLYWHEALINLHNENAFQELIKQNKMLWTKHEDKTEKSTKNTKEEKVDYIWQTPNTTSSQLLSQADYFEGGVSQYLARLETDNSEELEDIEKKPSQESFRLQTAARSGQQLHRVLQFWNGDMPILSQLLDSFDNKKLAKKVEEACIELKEIAELKPYWQELKKAPQNVIREFPIEIKNPNYTLWGVIDALIIQKNLCTVIDWKSASNLNRLKEAKRMDKIRQQLDLYSEALRPSYESISTLAIGISLSDRASKRVEVLNF